MFSDRRSDMGLAVLACLLGSAWLLAARLAVEPAPVLLDDPPPGPSDDPPSDASDDPPPGPSDDPPAAPLPDDWEHGFEVLRQVICDVVPVHPQQRADGTTSPSRADLVRSIDTARHLRIAPRDWAKVIGVEDEYATRSAWLRRRESPGKGAPGTG